MENIDNQQVYWDSVAWDKVFTHPINIELFQANVPLESRILDYGCGYGRTVRELSNNGYRNVVGIDSSSLMIERGRRTYPNLNLEVLLDSHVPYDDGSFDAIILLAVLTCIPTNVGQKNLIDNLKRLLRSGGIIYISDYCLQEDERNLQRYEKFAKEFGTYGVFRLPEGAIMRHHSLDWIKTLLFEFEMINLSRIEVATMNGHQAKVFQYMGSSQVLEA
jgi:SAM-dependent methyltransferase